MEGCWFDSPGLHVKVSLGKILNQTAPDVLVGTLHDSHHHQCVNYCESLWTKVLAKCNNPPAGSFLPIKYNVSSYCVYAMLTPQSTF